MICGVIIPSRDFAARRHLDFQSEPITATGWKRSKTDRVTYRGFKRRPQPQKLLIGFSALAESRDRGAAEGPVEIGTSLSDTGLLDGWQAKPCGDHRAKSFCISISGLDRSSPM
jgi:hypothetical protein